jgi:hypothetical protein
MYEYVHTLIMYSRKYTYLYIFIYECLLLLMTKVEGEIKGDFTGIQI